ncbi:MAG: DNA replication complex GINS family protein [Desulfurococcales archaeon]|nr:DNA replication complex GINS family protein [Desulfurococcales archaeon]
MIKPFAELSAAYHLLTPVRVAVLKSLGKVKVEGRWEAFEKGDEASLPLWLSEELRKLGYVDPREQELTDSDVGKYLMVEKGLKSNEFASLRERFYLEARELLKELREGAPKRSEDVLRAIKLEGNLSDLQRIRTRKIVQIAFLGGKVEEFADKLLPEERALFTLIREMLSEWSAEVLGSGELG